MSMLLLLPLGLAALASLLLPLLVHLARRSEQRTLPFAALRWLRAAPQPRRRHRLEELLLLLLRLLLLAALALLLAQPVLFGRPDRRPRVVVAPGVDLAAARALAGDAQAHWQWLAPGFPAFDPLQPEATTAANKNATASAATLPSLLRQFDAELPAGVPLTVVVPATLDDADAQRPVLTREVAWRVTPGAGTAAKTGRPPEAEPRDRALRLQVRHAPQRTASVRYLRAAGAAWALVDPSLLGSAPAEKKDPSKLGSAGGDDRASSSGFDPVTAAPATQPLEANAPFLAWLVPGPVPDTVRDRVIEGGTVLLDADAQWPGFPEDAPIVWRDADGALARAIRAGRGRAIRLERPLLPAAMPVLLEPDFPRQLRGLLAGDPPPPARADARSYAPLTGASPYPERPRPLSPWLAVLVATLFLLERWWASGRRRGAAA